MSKQLTLTFSVHMAWWLKPYLQALSFFAFVSNATPDPEKLKKVLIRGVVVKVEAR